MDITLHDETTALCTIGVELDLITPYTKVVLRDRSGNILAVLSLSHEQALSLGNGLVMKATAALQRSTQGRHLNG
jgi:hypothetical protein